MKKTEKQDEKISIGKFFSDFRYSFNETKRQIDPKRIIHKDTLSAMASDSVSACVNRNAFYEWQGNIASDNRFLGFATYALLAQNGILNRIASTFAEEMTRKWIEFYSTDDSDLTDEIKSIEQAIVDFKLKEKTYTAIWNTIVYGGCLTYIKLKGDDEKIYEAFERENELALEPEKIKKGDLVDFCVIDPIFCSPIKWDAMDPFSRWFYVVELWNVLGWTVHSSRMCMYIQNQAPVILRPKYMFFGISLLQMTLPYFNNFESTRENISAIIGRYNINVLKTSITAILNSNSNPEDVQKEKINLVNRVKMANKIRDNFGTIIIDKDNEELEQLSMDLNNLSDLLTKQAEFLAIVPQIPLTKLFGISPSGMNATGESDIRNFYDRVMAENEKFVRPCLEKQIDVIQLHLFGKIFKNIKFKFNSLWELDKLQEAQVRNLNAQTYTTYTSDGILSQKTIVDKLVDDEDSGFNNIDIEDIKNEEEEWKTDTAEQSDSGSVREVSEKTNKRDDEKNDEKIQKPRISNKL